jgi:hypothetical protein
MPQYIEVLGYTIPTIVVAAVTGGSLFLFLYLSWVDFVESLERCPRTISTSFDPLRIEAEDSGHNLEGMWTKVTVTLSGNGPIEAYKNQKFKGLVWPILFGIAQDAINRSSAEQINYQVYSNTKANLRIICNSYGVELSEVICLISYPDE